MTQRVKRLYQYATLEQVCVEKVLIVVISTADAIGTYCRGLIVTICVINVLICITYHYMPFKFKKYFKLQCVPHIDVFNGCVNALTLWD